MAHDNDDAGDALARLQAALAAIPSHKTSTSDAAWDSAPVFANLSAEAGRATFRKAYAWVNPDGDPNDKGSYAGGHHFVDSFGAVGAASTKGCMAIIDGLNTSDAVPAADRQGVYNHARKHLIDAGVAAADIPALGDGFAAHDAYDGAHSHDHSCMAGDGSTHTHEHMHSGDASHDHTHDPAMMPGDGDGDEASATAVTAAAHTLPGFTAALVASGGSWGILQDDRDWIVVGREGEAARFVVDADAIDPRLAQRRAANAALARLGELAAQDSAMSCGRFRSEAIPEGVETSDGRLIEAGATKWSRLATQGTLPVMCQTVTEIGHFGAVLCGRIDAVTRDGSTIVTEGDFDDSDAGREACAIVEARGRFGVSVDIMEMESEFECTEMDEGWCISGLLTVTDCELGGETLTPFPAFAEAFIEMAEMATTNAQAAAVAAPAARPAPCRSCGAEEAIVAAIPVQPPAAWFSDPVLAEPTATTITADGRIFGHAFLWDSCHVGYQQTCVRPPRSASNYQGFRVGSVVCAGGEEVAVGRITMATGHANLTADHRSTAAHYDDTGTAVADVTFGEDRFGGWFAGALRPGVTPEQVRTLRASAMSGDWRKIGGRLELVAVLAVNVPGFPVPRVGLAAGAVVSVLAAGGQPLAFEPDPVADAIAAFEARMMGRLHAIEVVLSPLRAAAAAAIVASAGVDVDEPVLEPEASVTA